MKAFFSEILKAFFKPKTGKSLQWDFFPDKDCERFSFFSNDTPRARSFQKGACFKKAKL